MTKISALILLLVSFSVGLSSAQNKIAGNEQSSDQEITKRFSLSYQTAFYYDPTTSIWFPLGMGAEYRLNKNNSSLDLQVMMYHPKALHVDDQYHYYSFISEYFVQYDLGLRLYFDKRKNDNTGIYFRPSVGVTTRYYRTVTYDINQNLGRESTRLTGKEFIGMQFGYKGKINPLFFANIGVGSLVSFFRTADKTIILLSPNIAISVGAAF